tara:strand:- start:593 stop:1450 length:858 start_codon:yes stop_codon:yes gene_type:complete
MTITRTDPTYLGRIIGFEDVFMDNTLSISLVFLLIYAIFICLTKTNTTCHAFFKLNVHTAFIATTIWGILTIILVLNDLFALMGNHNNAAYESCPVYYDCSEGNDNSLVSKEYQFMINDKRENCPNFGTRREEGNLNLMNYYIENREESVHTFSGPGGTVWDPEWDCEATEFGCCYIHSTCNYYKRSGYSYSLYNRTVQRGFPVGFTSTYQSKVDSEGSNCMTDKSIIEFYIDNETFTDLYLYKISVCFYLIVLVNVYLIRKITLGKEKHTYESPETDNQESELP